MAVIGTVVAACSAKTQYEWGDYNKALLSYYKNPQEVAEFSEKLRESVEEAEGAGKVPPGLYAEYGYALLELGDEQAALAYFAKEQETWPESAYLMTKVISRLKEMSSATAQSDNAQNDQEDL